MQFFVTVSSKSILRITDGEGASLTFRLRKDEAQVLFISVPSDKRRTGRGKALLLAAEKLLGLRGIKRVYADFVDSVEAGDGAGAEIGGGAGVRAGAEAGGGAGVRGLLEGAGYEAAGEVDIVAIATGMVLYDPNVKRALEAATHGAYFIALSDLNVSQMRSAIRFLSSIKADISCYDMAHFNNRISGAVCSRDGEPIVMILCSDNGDDLHVDALISKAGSDSSAVLVAILGMLNAMRESGAEFAYKRVTMVGYNSKLTKLIRRTLSSETELAVIGKAVSMCKDIEKGASDTGSSGSEAGAGSRTGSSEKHEYKAAKDDFMENAWERELIRFPLQKNVTWKGPWSRIQ